MYVKVLMDVQLLYTLWPLWLLCWTGSNDGNSLIGQTVSVLHFLDQRYSSYRVWPRGRVMGWGGKYRFKRPSKNFLPIFMHLIADDPINICASV